MTKTPDYSILDCLLEGCQIIGFDFRYLYLNDAAVKQARKSKEELLGRTMTEVYPGIETTPMFSVLKECLNERKSAELENEFAFPDGQAGWFLLKMHPVPEGVFILSLDISAHKQAKIDLQHRLQQMSALYAIDRAILATKNLSLLCQSMLMQIVSVLRVDAAAILLFEPQSGELEFAAGHGFFTSKIEKTRFRIGQGHLGRAALERRTLFIPHLHKDVFLRASLIEHERFVSYLATPLISQEQLIGVLEVFTRSPLSPDSNWVAFFEALGRQVAMGLDSIQTSQELRRALLDLTLSYDLTIEGWSKALDLRDHDTEGHTVRVTEMTVLLAQMANVQKNEIVHVRRGALLHDIGKMGVPDAILLKPDKLTDDEWEIMRKHPVYAYEWLSPIEYLKPALAIPYSHHEKWDGTGYPQGLKGEQIPLPARLFAVVDVWDALSHDCPYRKAWSQERAAKYIREQAGKHFDPNVVGLFLQLLEREEPTAG